MSEWILTESECKDVEEIIEEYNSLPEGMTLYREVGVDKAFIFVDIGLGRYYHGYIYKGNTVYFILCISSYSSCPYCYKCDCSSIYDDEEDMRFRIQVMGSLGAIIEKEFKIKGVKR